MLVPKTIADVGLHVAVCLVFAEYLFPWSRGIMCSSAPVFPYFCCHRVAAGDQQRAPCERPRCRPGGLPAAQLQPAPAPQPSAAPLLGGVVMLPPQQESLRPPRTGAGHREGSVSICNRSAWQSCTWFNVLSSSE